MRQQWDVEGKLVSVQIGVSDPELKSRRPNRCFRPQHRTRAAGFLFHNHDAGSSSRAWSRARRGIDLLHRLAAARAKMALGTCL